MVNMRIFVARCQLIETNETEHIIQELQDELDDALKISAPMFWHQAAKTCNQGAGPDDCTGYHGTWQFLVLWRVLRSMRAETGKFLEYFRILARSGEYENIFISGASDYYLLAHIVRAYSIENARVNLTVLDVCKTPLVANQWYADRQGINIETIPGDILNFQSGKQYDAICSHSLFLWLSPDEQGQVIKTWYDLLRPGGKVLTSTRLFSGPLGSLHNRSDQETLEFRQRLGRSAMAHADEYDLDPALITDARYEYMVRERKRYIVNDSQVYQKMFKNAGFHIEKLELWDDSKHTPDLPVPKQGSLGRLHIIARRD